VITVTPGKASTLTSLVSLKSATQVASGSGITVMLQTIDASENLETTGGLAVAFKLVNTKGAQGTFGKVTYVGNGLYEATFTGSIAGTNLIEATIAGAKVVSTTPITVTPGQYSLSKSVVTVTPAAQGGGITVTLQTKDAAGNDLTANLPTEGVPIVFELGSTTTGGQGVFGTATYLGNGEYTATFTPLIAGNNTVVALIDSVKVTSKAPTITIAT
jgi:hypothetical protein